MQLRCLSSAASLTFLGVNLSFSRLNQVLNVELLLSAASSGFYDTGEDASLKSPEQVIC